MAINVISPYGLVTGGTDALHQLCFYLKSVGYDSHIVYVDISSKEKQIPRQFLQYISGFKLIDDIKDEPTEIVIVPETLSFVLDRFTKVRKYIWWLSVDNNLNQNRKDKIQVALAKVFSKKFWKKVFNGYYSVKKLQNFNKNKPYNFENEDKGIVHLCASYYAYYFVKAKSNNTIKLLLDPISDYFLNRGFYFSPKNRKNIVLYNPKKNLKFSQKIISAAPDITFLPLENFNQEQLVSLYRSSKLYMDFGNFPGSDRIPREAGFNGMLLITGKNGASGIHEDVPIPDDCKFDSIDLNVSEIVKKIKYMLDNFENEYDRFEEYRETIIHLKQNYIAALKTLF